MTECTLFQPKKDLSGRKIYFDDTKITELTADEIYLIKAFIRLKIREQIKTTLCPISSRFHLDFIGFNNAEYMDILICKTKSKKRNFFL